MSALKLGWRRWESKTSDFAANQATTETAVLGQLGRSSEAAKAVNEILGIQSEFAGDPRRFLNCFIFTDDLIDHLLDGLTKAGFRG